MLEKLQKLPLLTKALSIVMAFVVSFTTCVIAIEDRYIDKKEIAQTLEQFDLKLQNQMHDIERANKLQNYDTTTELYFKTKRQLRLYPDDLELQEDLKYFEEKREKIKQELDL